MAVHRSRPSTRSIPGADADSEAERPEAMPRQKIIESAKDRPFRTRCLAEDEVLPELRQALVECAQALKDAPPETFQFDRLTRRYLEIVVKACRGNVSTAARVLGWHRRTLQRRLLKCSTGNWH